MRPATIADVHVIARTLRPADRAEIEALGLDPVQAIRANFRQSVFRVAAVSDHELLAVGGLVGSMLSDFGYPWLVTAPGIETIPVSFVKEARAVVTQMLALKERLEGHVAADYRGACRLIEVLGFTLDEPMPFGPKAALFRRYSMGRA